MRHPLLLAILAGLAGCESSDPPFIGDIYEERACVEWPADQACPSADEAEGMAVFLGHLDCRYPSHLDAILDEGTRIPEGEFLLPACCYPALWQVTTDAFAACPGRPFQPQGQPLLAPSSSTDPWAELARAEHASIAAFARLQLDLMALGAPLELLQQVAAAMGDEVRHAQLAVQQAERSQERSVSIGPFPFPSPIEPTRDLARLAYDAVREGCIGETISAAATREAARQASDPVHAEVLAAVADDEDRHAVLSWKLVAWALGRGGPDVRDAVIRAFEQPAPQLQFPLLAETSLRQLETDVLMRVVHPASRVLLAAPIA